MQDRSSYKPQQRLGAIAKAKAYKSQLSRNQKQKQFATEQKPGTGGFTQGLSRQQQRMREVGQEKRRAESFRPEDAVSRDIYKELSN